VKTIKRTAKNKVFNSFFVRIHVWRGPVSGGYASNLPDPFPNFQDPFLACWICFQFQKIRHAGGSLADPGGSGFRSGSDPRIPYCPPADPVTQPKLPGFGYGFGYGSGSGSARFLKSQDPDTARIRPYKKYNNIFFNFKKTYSEYDGIFQHLLLFVLAALTYYQQNYKQY